MMKRSKVFIAGLLAGSMMLSQPAPVLAQDVPADSDELILESIEEAFDEDSEENLEDADFAFEENVEEASDEIVLDEELEEDAELEALVTAGGMILTAEERAYRSSVIAHAGETDLSSLEEGIDYVADEVITLATSKEDAEAIAAAYNGSLKDFSYGIATINLDDSTYSVTEAYNAGINSDYVMPAVEPNYLTVLTDPVNSYDQGEAEFESGSAFSPADWSNVYYDWGYDDPALNPANNNIDGITYQWFHDMINTYSAWAVSTGNPEIVVAVIDSGVRDSHEELSGKVIIPSDLTMNFPHNQDNIGHGTHVAAIIAGKKENEKGGAGVAPDCKILAINATEYNETYKNYVFSNEDEAKAIRYVAGYNKNGSKTERRADIINMSLGGVLYSSLVDEACQDAVKAGVTVIAAMGNEYSNAMSYPAAYDNVISVAANNEAGVKTNFSNFGSWCEISAPGAAIYSAIADSDSAYAAWDGTSMATPVVAGACALYMSVYGHTAPDKMADVLAKSASKTTSKGVGAGIIDLAKMFGGDDKAPTVTVTDKDGNVLGSATGDTLTIQGVQSIETKISVKAGAFDGDEESNKNTKVVFSLNGKNPSLKNETLSNGYYVNYSSWHETARSLMYYFAESEKQKNVTLKFATVTGMGVLSKISTINITMEGTEDSSYRYMYIQGQNAVPKGTSATYKAGFYRNAIKNKKVVLDIDDASKASGATIKNGKVTIPSTFALSSFTITATSEEDSLLTASRTINTPDQKVNSVVISTIDAHEFNKVTKNKKTGSATSATLYSVNIDSEGFETDETILYVSTNYLSKTGEYVSGSSFSMSSSNNKVARASFDEKGRSYIKAYSPGTAKITFSALDGSNKKATIKIKVVTPASYVAITTKNNQLSYVGLGKSVTAQATVGDAYGKPTNSKVKWSYKIYGAKYDSESKNYIYSDAFDDATTKAVMKTKIFSFSNGKLKTGKRQNLAEAFKYLPEEYSDTLAFEVIATTADGTNYSDSTKYILYAPTTYMYAYVGVDEWGNPIGSPGTNWSVPLIVDDALGIYIKADGIQKFEVTSSDPQVASCEMSGSYLVVAPHKLGTVSVKIKAMDGSNKSLTLKIMVVEPKSS